MAKKIVKIVLFILSVTAVILGAVYVFKNYIKKEESPETMDGEDEAEEHLEAKDALDLSSLKFSRHYVDLR